MTLFRGRSHIKLDPKGRLSLSASFRQAITKSQQVMITNSIYKDVPYLDLHTAAEWLKIEKRINKMPQLRTEVQVFQRFYISGCESCEIDSQFRILLPQHLREYAELSEQIVLVGMGHKIEIWSEKNWGAVFKQLQKEFASASSELAELEKTGGRK